MIRLVCPFCHCPLSAADLELASVEGHQSLLCPECQRVLLSDYEHWPDCNLREVVAADA